MLARRILFRQACQRRYNPPWHFLLTDSSHEPRQRFLLQHKVRGFLCSNDQGPGSTHLWFLVLRTCSVKRAKIAGEPHLMRRLAQQSIAWRIGIPIHYLRKCPPEMQAYNMNFWISIESKVDNPLGRIESFNKQFQLGEKESCYAMRHAPCAMQFSLPGRHSLKGCRQRRVTDSRRWVVPY
jgi:hypothetical protein